MSSQLVWGRLGRKLRSLLRSAMVAGGLAGLAGPAAAQDDLPIPPIKLWNEGAPVAAAGRVDPAVVPAGCFSCGTGHSMSSGTTLPAIPTPELGEIGLAPCVDGCNSSRCKPGKAFCNSAGGGAGGLGCDDSQVGRLFGGLYECLCCPDPCYEPSWLPVANAAFFVDSPRPVTHQRWRFDAGYGMFRPDQNELFLPKTSVAGGGKGPGQNGRFIRRLNYYDLSMYVETAAGPSFAAFVNTPYRWIYTQQTGTLNPGAVQEGANGFDQISNFNDIAVGTKSVFVDCELCLLTFQFTTYIPVGTSVSAKHTSLEPGFLAAIKLSDVSYIQAQALYWIPLGGDNDYQASLWRWGFSVNRQLCKAGNSILIGTAELDGITFAGGAFTDINTVVNDNKVNTRSGNQTYFTVGPGLRWVFCDKFDLGFGAAFSTSPNIYGPNQLYRSEFRIRF